MVAGVRSFPRAGECCGPKQFTLECGSTTCGTDSQPSCSAEEWTFTAFNGSCGTAMCGSRRAPTDTSLSRTSAPRSTRTPLCDFHRAPQHLLPSNPKFARNLDFLPHMSPKALKKTPRLNPAKPCKPWKFLRETPSGRSRVRTCDPCRVKAVLYR